MEIIRYHKHCLCLCKYVLILFFHSHQLINRIKALLLNTGSCVKLCLRYIRIHGFVDVLCSVIPVGNRISNHFVVFIQQEVGTAVDIVKNTIRNTLNAVKGTFGEWAQAGRDMIMGFVGGIRDKAGEVLNSVVSAIKSAYEAATSFLRTGSPSKLFEDIGINTMQGFAKGIEATRNVPAVAARNAAGGVSRSATVTYNSAPIINSQAAMLQLLAMTRAQSITQTAMKAV